MCVAVVGGMKRLKRHYVAEAHKLGVEVRVFNTAPKDFTSRLRDVDGLVVFTNQTSHAAKVAAVKTARREGIPVRLAHSCGVCSLRNCVKCLADEVQGSEAGLRPQERAEVR